MPWLLGSSTQKYPSNNFMSSSWENQLSFILMYLLYFLFFISFLLGSCLNSGMLDGFHLPLQLCIPLFALGPDLSGPRQWALMSSGLWLGLTSGGPGRRSESRKTEVLVYHPLFLQSCLRLALSPTNMRSLLLVLH